MREMSGVLTSGKCSHDMGLMESRVDGFPHELL